MLGFLASLFDGGAALKTIGMLGGTTVMIHCEAALGLALGNGSDDAHE
jgi:hypothetical protein